MDEEGCEYGVKQKPLQKTHSWLHCAYCTVSTATVLVFTGTPSWILKVKEEKRLYDKRGRRNGILANGILPVKWGPPPKNSSGVICQGFYIKHL